VQNSLNAIAARLGDPSTWQYGAEGGPADQSSIPDAIEQVRFEYEYILYDGSMGVHNRQYVKRLLRDTDVRLKSVGR